MKIEDAIEKIKASTDLCDTFCCYENCKECVGKYIDYAIAKQIPKEPEIIIDNQLNYADAILCPNCKHDLMGGAELDAGHDPPYCWECGQALKWSGKDED